MVGCPALPAHALVEFVIWHRLRGTEVVVRALVEYVLRKNRLERAEKTLVLDLEHLIVAGTSVIGLSPVVQSTTELTLYPLRTRPRSAFGEGSFPRVTSGWP